MLHVGLDLSRGRVDVCLISSDGELVGHFRFWRGRICVPVIARAVGGVSPLTIDPFIQQRNQTRWRRVMTPHHNLDPIAGVTILASASLNACWA